MVATSRLHHSTHSAARQSVIRVIGKVNIKVRYNKIGNFEAKFIFTLLPASVKMEICGF